MNALDVLKDEMDEWVRDFHARLTKMQQEITELKEDILNITTEIEYNYDLLKNLRTRIIKIEMDNNEVI